MITKNNIEEFILLDIDNELNKLQHDQLMQYLLTDAQSALLYQQYKNATLHPNHAEKFDAKMNLFAIANTTKENSNKKYFSIFKYAASILLLIGFTTYLLKNDKNIIDTESQLISTNNNNLSNIKVDTITHTTLPAKNNEAIVASNISPIQNSPNYKHNISNYKKSINNNKLQRSELIAVLPKNESKNTAHTYISETNDIAAIDQIELSPIKNIPVANILFATTPNAQNQTNIKQLGAEINLPNKILVGKNNNQKIEIELQEPSFLSNNKAYQVFQKVGNAIASLSPEAKNILQNGVDIEWQKPKNILRNPH